MSNQLDGDEVRAFLSKGLGFSRTDRDREHPADRRFAGGVCWREAWGDCAGFGDFALPGRHGTEVTRDGWGSS